MEKTYKLNGKWATKEEVDAAKGAKFIKNERINRDWYETPEYTTQQAKNSRKFFDDLQDNIDDMELKYG
jgi:hypothetical protein